MKFPAHFASDLFFINHSVPLSLTLLVGNCDTIKCDSMSWLGELTKFHTPANPQVVYGYLYPDFDLVIPKSSTAGICSFLQIDPKWEGSV